MHSDVWVQNPNALGEVWLSALLAAVPIFFLFYALAIRRLRGHVAALATAGIAAGIAVLAFGMPIRLAALSLVYGALYGLFPIGWIVVTAIYLYNLTVHTGLFETIKDSIAAVTDDRRLQALLIAFSFGAFLEGAAGFGTPVAISGAMLVGLGFNALYAAGICLIANTVPVAFAAIGVPIIVAGEVTGIDPLVISQMVGRQLPLLSFFVPFWLILVMSGWNGVRGVWPAVLVSGGAFAITQGWAANVLGPLLPSVMASLASIVALILLLRVWRPASAWRFPDEPPVTYERQPLTWQRTLRAWVPFILLTLLIATWSIAPATALLDTTTLRLPFPGLHQRFAAPGAAPTEVLFKLNWLSAAGTAILIAAGLTLALFRVPVAQGARVFADTARMLTLPLVTIMAILGFAFVTNFSGMSTALALALTATGFLYPLLAPMLGWVGVLITGSDTSANALFGKLQAVTAAEVGVEPVLMVAANTSGGVTGKMVSPQSIAVATAAAGLVGRESDLFRFAVGHSLFFLALVSALTYAQAYWLSWMVPQARPAAPAAESAATTAGGGYFLILAALLVLLLWVFVWRNDETSDPNRREG